MLPPMPNLFFTRDTAMAVGEHVLIGSMRFGIRWSEELLMKALFAHHPALAGRGILYDGSLERRHNHTLEGGDVHVLRRDTVMIGFSERSSPSAIDHLAELLFAREGVENVIVVVMPAENTAIHLDMIFTQIDREHCVIYPPHFLGPGRLPVLLWRKGEATLSTMPDVFAALRACGLPWSRSAAAATAASCRSASSGRAGATSSPCAPASSSRTSATRRRCARSRRPGSRPCPPSRSSPARRASPRGSAP